MAGKQRFAWSKLAVEALDNSTSVIKILKDLEIRDHAHQLAVKANTSTAE